MQLYTHVEILQTHRWLYKCGIQAASEKWFSLPLKCQYASQSSSAPFFALINFVVNMVLISATFPRYRPAKWSHRLQNSKASIPDVVCSSAAVVLHPVLTQLKRSAAMRGKRCYDKQQIDHVNPLHVQLIWRRDAASDYGSAPTSLKQNFQSAINSNQSVCTHDRWHVVVFL